LEDLYTFPHAYEQVYFVLFSLHSRHNSAAREKISDAYTHFPWQGGYSAVHFYNNLKGVTGEDSPTIKSISYSSPGWLELTVFLSVAINIEKIVKSLCTSMKTADSTYTAIIKGMQARKLLRLKTRQEILKLKKKELEYITESSRAIQALLGKSPLNEIDKVSDHPYRTLKILLSFYRRIRVLASYQMEGKADFSNHK
jgi:hypothetical protein